MTAQRDHEPLSAAARRLSDAITDRAAAGRGNLDTTYDVDAKYLAAVKALRATLAATRATPPEPAAGLDVERLARALPDHLLDTESGKLNRLRLAQQIAAIYLNTIPNLPEEETA